MSTHLIVIDPEPKTLENRKALLEWSSGKPERRITDIGFVVEVSDNELAGASCFGSVRVLATKDTAGPATRSAP